MKKNLFCPNKSLPQAQVLIKRLGLRGFYKAYIANNYEIPDPRTVNYNIFDFAVADEDASEGETGKGSKVIIDDSIIDTPTVKKMEVIETYATKPEPKTVINQPLVEEVKDTLDMSFDSFIVNNPFATEAEYNTLIDKVDKSVETNPVFTNTILKYIGKESFLSKDEVNALLESNMNIIPSNIEEYSVTDANGNSSNIRITKYQSGRHKVETLDSKGRPEATISTFNSLDQNSIQDSLNNSFESHSSLGKISDKSASYAIKGVKAKIISEQAVKNVDQAIKDQAVNLYKLYLSNKSFENLEQLEDKVSSSDNLKGFRNFIKLLRLGKDTGVLEQVFVDRNLFNAIQQEEIADNIIYKISQYIDQITANGGKPGIKEILGYIISDFQATVNQASAKASVTEDLNIKTKLNNVVSKYTNVLNNMPKFYNLAIDKMSLNGLQVKNNRGLEQKALANSLEGYLDTEINEDGELDSVEAAYRKLDYADEANFAMSSKDTASQHLKSILSLVPKYKYSKGEIERNPNGSPKFDTSYLGLPAYESLSKIWAELLYKLHTVPMGKKLEALEASDNPKHKVIASMIRNSPHIELENELEVVFSKQQANFITVLASRPSADGARVRNLKVIETNRRTADNIILEDWYENMLNTDLVKKNDAGNVEVIKGSLSKITKGFDTLFNNYNNLAGTKKDSKGKELLSYLKNVGIDLSDVTLEKLFSENTDVADKAKAVSAASYIIKALNSPVQSMLLEDRNPFVSIDGKASESNNVKYLSNLENLYNPVIFEASFISGDNKAKYSFVNNTYLTHQMNKIKSDPNYLEELNKTHFASNSLWLTMLRDNSTFRNNFKLFYLDTLGNEIYSDGKNKPFKSMNNAEKELTRVGLYTNGGSGTSATGGGVGGFISMINSDKTTHPVFLTNKFKLSSELDAEGNYNVSDKSYRQILKPMILSEFARVKATILDINKGVNNISNYNTGAKLGAQFIVFDYLNDIILTKDSDGNPMIKEDYTEEMVDIASKEFFNNLTKSQLEYWESLGLTDKINSSGYTKKRFGKDDGKMTSENINEFAMEYAQNQFIAMFNQLQMISGDPALHAKKNIEGTWVNFFKRMAKDIAPGLDGNFKDKTVKYVILEDFQIDSKNLEEYTKIIGYKSRAYSEKGMNPADAQEYTTLDEHINVLEAYGRITQSKREAINRLKAGGSNAEDIAIALEPMKPVYVETVPVDGINHVYYIKTSSFPLIPALTKGLDIDKLRVAMENSGAQRAVFESGIKLGVNKGMVDSFNKETNGFALEDGIAQERIMELPRSGFRIQMELPSHGATHEIKEGSQMRKLILNNIPLGAEVKLGDAYVDGSKVKDVFNRLHIQKMNRIYHNAIKEMGFDPKTGQLVDVQKIASILSDEAKTRGYTANDVNSIQLVVQDGKFVLKTPLIFNAASAKFEAILNSRINKAIDLDLPGFTAVQGSSVGMKVLSLDAVKQAGNTNFIQWVDSNYTELKTYAHLKKISGEDKIKFSSTPSENSVYINTDSIGDPTANLQLGKVVREELDRLSANGLDLDIVDVDINHIKMIYPMMNQTQLQEVKDTIIRYNNEIYAADIIVPKYLGNINLEDYLRSDGTLDTDRLPEELLEIIGIRIPTQGYNSMIKFRVRGFLSEVMGDFAIVPYEVVAQMGSDFDVDKLFMYRKHFTKGNDGKLTVVKSYLKDALEGKDLSKLKDAEIDNTILDIIYKRLEDPAIFAQMLEPNGFGEFPDLAKYFANNNKSTYLSTNAQNNVHSLNNDGKVGVGIFSLYSTFLNKLHSTEGSYYQFGDNSIRVKNSKGQNIMLGDLQNIYAINDDYKSNVIMYLQSAAVDNSKEQILGSLNINGDTMNAVGSMAFLGLDEKYISYLLKQPMVEKLIKELGTVSDITGDSSNYANKSEYVNTYVYTALYEGLNNGSLSGKYFKGENFKLESVRVDLDLDTLLKSIDNNESFDNNQMDALLAFKLFYDSGDKFSKLMSVTNIDNKGLGATFAETLAKNLSIKELLNSSLKPSYPIIGATKLLTDQNDPSVVASAMLADSIRLFSNIYDLYQPVYLDNFKYMMEVFNLDPTVSNVKKLFNNIRSYAISGIDLNGLNSREIRYELLHGANNIAKQLNDYKKTPEGADNLLTKRIYAKTKVRSTDYNGIRTDNNPSSNDATDVNRTMAHFYDMVLSNDEATKELADNIVLYHLVTGANFSPVSISKYIALDSLEKYNFSKQIRNINNNFISELKNHPYRFLTQYIQNNPNDSFNVDYEDMVRIGKGLYEVQSITSDSKIPFINTYDTNNNLRLFGLNDVSVDGNSVYREIPVNSDKFLSNYTFNEDLVPLSNMVNFKEVIDINMAKDIIITNFNDNEMQNSVDKFDLQSSIPSSNHSKGEGAIAANNLFGYKEGASPRVVLSNMMEVTKDPKLSKLINALLVDFVDLDKVNLGYTDDKVNGKANGLNVSMNANDMASRYRGKFSDRFIQTLVHEVIHASTDYYLNPATVELTNQQRAARNNINRLFSAHKESYADQVKLNKYINIFNKFSKGTLLEQDEFNFLTEYKDELYGYTSVYEFVTEGLTNPEFRQGLEDKSLWKRFKDLISALIGIKKSDADVLFDSFNEFLTTSRTFDRAMGQGQTSPVTELNNADISKQYEEVIKGFDKLVLSQISNFESKFRVKEFQPITQEQIRNLEDSLYMYDDNFSKIKAVMSSEGQLRFFERNLPSNLEIRKSIYKNLYSKDRFDIFSTMKDADESVVEDIEVPDETGSPKVEEYKKGKLYKVSNSYLNRLINSLSRKRSYVKSLEPGSFRNDQQTELDKLERIYLDLNKSLNKNNSFVHVLGLMESKVAEAELIATKENPSINEIYDIITHIEAIKSLSSEVVLPKEEAFEELNNRINNVTNEAARQSRVLLSKIPALLDAVYKDNVSMEVNTARLSETGVKDVGKFESDFLDFSQSSSLDIQAMGYLIEKFNFEANQEHSKFAEEFSKLLEDYHKQHGKKFDMFLEKNSKGERTGRMISKYTAEYISNLDDRKFMSKNTTPELTRELDDKYKADEAHYKDILSPKEFKKWLKENDRSLFATRYKAGRDVGTTKSAAKYFTFKVKDEFLSKEYQDIMSKPETDPTRKLLKYFEKTLKPLNAKYGTKDGYIPEVKPSYFDYVMRGDIVKGAKTLNDEFKEAFINSQDIMGDDIDSITGDVRMNIPIRMFNDKLDQGEKSYDLARIIELVKIQEIGLKYKHKAEPILKLHYNLLNNAKTISDVVTKDGHEVITDRKAVRLTEQALFLTQNYLYDFTRDKTKDEQNFGKVVDMAGSYLRTKGMGWNPFSAIGNLMQSVTTNLTFASGNQYFGMNDYFKGLQTALHTVGGVGDTKKIEALMDKLDVQGLVNEIIVDKSRTLKVASKDKLDALNPMFMTQRVELFNQSHTMVSILNSMEFDKPDGSKYRLYDAFDKEGKFNSEFGENPFNDKDLLFKTQMKIRKAIIDIHGNYVRPMKAKTKYYNRALLIFRTWLPQAINNRFGAYSEDEFLGTATEGRYRTAVKLAKQGDILNTIKSIYGENVANLKAYEIANIRKNVAELAMIAALSGIMLVMSKFIDDDDDESGFTTYATNSLFRAQNDLQLFLSPQGFKEMIQDPIPAWAIVSDVQGVLYGVNRTLTGDPVYKTGLRKDRSVLAKEIMDLIPFVTQIDKNVSFASKKFSDFQR